MPRRKQLISTTVEIILYYLTYLNFTMFHISTTVEIILYYLTYLLNRRFGEIYNSRNHSILLNSSFLLQGGESTTVEIILYYLTPNLCICTIF